eukprot:tig00021275_g19882.t1
MAGHAHSHAARGEPEELEHQDAERGPDIEGMLQVATREIEPTANLSASTSGDTEDDAEFLDRVMHVAGTTALELAAAAANTTPEHGAPLPEAAPMDLEAQQRLLRQPSGSLPPYVMRDDAAAAALRAQVEAVGDVFVREVRSGERPPMELAERLAAALSDARLLGTSLFRTFAGRTAVRAMLAAMRAVGKPGMAQGVVRALVAALQRSPPAAWTPAEAELMVDHATALVLAFTAERARAADDLFALRWTSPPACLVGRVQLLGGELGAAEGALRPKALLFCAMTLDRAWAELVKRQMTPSALEAALIPPLTELLFTTGQTRSAMHVAEKAYHLEGESPEARYSQYLALFTRVWTISKKFCACAPLNSSTRIPFRSVGACRWRGDLQGAIAASERALAILEQLGPGYTTVTIRMRTMHFFNLIMAGPSRLADARRVWQAVVQQLVALGDPALPENDVNANLSVRKCTTHSDMVKPKTILQWTILGLAASVRNDPEMRTPLTAHYHFWLGETYLTLRKEAKAAGHLATAAQIYRTRFPEAFPADCPRISRIVAALAELRASRPARAPGLFSRLFGLARAGAGTGAVHPMASSSVSEIQAG